MIVTILRQQPRAAALVLALIAANLLAWGWAFAAFGGSGALMAASLLAWVTVCATRWTPTISRRSTT
ncbi:HoxN/HupN/NixA family nickel/cobalt transporter [Klebsiella michiganensis]|nr:HoxN/HupN/NixA family nickel/cobalt transporter [Klebsiella michiganensis]